MSARPEGSPGSGSDDEGRWQWLALTLAALLAQNRDASQAESERHAAEQAAQRAEHAQDRARERGIFLDLVAHELKTPLAVIKAYAELLEAQAAAEPSPRAMHEVVGHILEQAEHMSALIHDVLDVQRLRQGKLPLEIGWVNLADLARDVAADVQQTSRAHAFSVAAPESQVVWVDRRRLRQVLVNLLDNAVKYSAGGEIRVRVGRAERDGRACALVEVQDEGVGIDPADLQRIFERFEQVSDAPIRGRVGLGLGLYLARQIARAHGGDVLAESPGRGRGSTFSLLLPLDVDPGG